MNARIVILDKPFNQDVVITRVENIDLTVRESTNLLQRLLNKKYFKTIIRFDVDEWLYQNNRKFDCKIEVFNEELKIIGTYCVVNAISQGKDNSKFIYEGECVEKFNWEF